MKPEAKVKVEAAAKDEVKAEPEEVKVEVEAKPEASEKRSSKRSSKQGSKKERRPQDRRESDMFLVNQSDFAKLGLQMADKPEARPPPPHAKKNKE